MTLLINLFGAPSAGKSTTAAGLFSIMKAAGDNAELVTEYAKQLCWADCTKQLSNSMYVTAKQHKKLVEVLGSGLTHNKGSRRLDYVVTDSPLLLGSFYALEYSTPYARELHTLVKALNASIEKDLQTKVLNVFIERDKKFNPAGRNHNEDQSDSAARSMINFVKFNTKDCLYTKSSTAINDVLNAIHEVQTRELML